MTWETVRLGELISAVQGRAGSAVLPVYSVTKHLGFVPSAEYFKKQVFSNDLTTYKVVHPGQFAYATIHLDEGSIGVAPVRCIISPMYTVFSTDPQRVSGDYLLRYLKSPHALAQYPRLGRGTAERRKSISLEALGRLTVPLPPLTEQRRIAAILDEADALRSRHARIIEGIGAVAEATFRRLEDAVLDGSTVSLDSIAEVSSGITKGRRAPAEPLTATHYMTVANVQDRRLDLSTVKQLDVSAREIERYRLVRGDLLLTEGGDPDKLGRGVVWSDELPVAIHQNHVFRVRLRSREHSPTWLNWEIGSAYGKRYFLRAAKQTTGIATINSNQLRAFPVRVPPRDIAERFTEELANVQSLRAAYERRAKHLDSLFASLQHRAFRGEL